jgi:branched-chain amino acid transport system permease protein
MKERSLRLLRSASRGSGQWWIVPLVLSLPIVFGPWLGLEGEHMQQLMNIGLLTLVLSGFNLSFGYGGQLAVGQAAMYAVGGYVAAILAVHGHDMALTVVAAAVGAAILGFVSGLPGLRLAGWGLAMTSFFLVLLLPDAVDILKGTTGGLDGLTGVPSPVLFGYALTRNGFYLTEMVLVVAWIVAMRNMVVSRHGNAWLVLRESPVLAQSLGINVMRLKLMSYVLGAVPAGIAGALFAYMTGFVSPAYFTFALAVSIIAGSILGGSQSVYGAVLGATLLEILTTQSTSFADHAYVAYGVMLVLGGVLLSAGIAGVARNLLHRLARIGGTPAEFVEGEALRIAMPAMKGKRLELVGVSKSFSGVHALNDVSITAEAGQITGLIGANGSGKTTAINVISGFYRPDHGQVLLGGEAVQRHSPHSIARRGVARTFQTPIVPATMTTLEVVAAARYISDYASLPSAILRLPKFRRVRAADREEAYRILEVLGIGDLAEKPASSLPLGSRRLVEVARAIARDPSVLLLDEPASGLDHREVLQLADVIRRVSAAGATVLLVEHNFEMICAVADNIFVLEFGSLLASGTPEEIRTSEAVARSYLGQLPETVATEQELAPVGESATRS